MVLVMIQVLRGGLLGVLGQNVQLSVGAVHNPGVEGVKDIQMNVSVRLTCLVVVIITAVTVNGVAGVIGLSVRSLVVWEYSKGLDSVCHQRARNYHTAVMDLHIKRNPAKCLHVHVIITFIIKFHVFD